MNYSQVKRNIEDMDLYVDAFEHDNNVLMREIETRHGCFGLASERALIKLHSDVEYSINQYLKTNHI